MRTNNDITRRIHITGGGSNDFLLNETISCSACHLIFTWSMENPDVRSIMVDHILYMEICNEITKSDVMRLPVKLDRESRPYLKITVPSGFLEIWCDWDRKTVMDVLQS